MLFTYFDKKKYIQEGTDYSDVEIKKAKKYASKIYKEDFLKMSFEKKFDIITMLEVLEHTRKPFQYLKKIHSDLNKNGIVMITVPNNDWLLMKGYKNDLISMHLFYFNKKTMTNLLKKAGFKDIKFYINVKVNYYENWYKTLAIQLTQLFAWCLYKISGLYIGKNIIVSARK
jgi:2-polyprenyl-3-methyl-5-hydroxy-6-metoxy-1,4-benzoquinol methylase